MKTHKKINGTERERLSVWKKEGLSNIDCAIRLGRSVSTIGRELKRNKTRGIRSGLAAAKARGTLLGRQPGQRIKADRLAPKVLECVKAGWSYRKIGRELNISKNTVTEIVKRYRHHQGV